MIRERGRERVPRAADPGDPGGEPGGEPGGDPGGEPAQVLGEWERKGKGEREAREVTQEGICYV